MGKSNAQDSLMRKLEDFYPDAFINDEVYIGDLIAERGYTVKEISDELGSKVHKMFVDIIMSDSDRTVAFEYHGEQHYSLVGNMTKTTADLMLNQQLDREKSWILNRIGIPLVAIPFDLYIDESVIEDLIDKSFAEVEDMRCELVECPQCNRFFPTTQMPLGICQRCRDRELEEQQEERLEKEERYHEAFDEWNRARHRIDESKEDKIARRKKEREKRKAKYKAYKETPEYKRRKEEEKRRRKEYNRKQREQRKLHQRQQELNEDDPCD